MLWGTQKKCFDSLRLGRQRQRRSTKKKKENKEKMLQHLKITMWTGLAMTSTSVLHLLVKPTTSWMTAEGRLESCILDSQDMAPTQPLPSALISNIRMKGAAEVAVGRA